MIKSAVLLCGGSGSRFGSNKLLVKLRGKEVFLHSLEKLIAVVGRENVVIAVSENQKNLFEKVLLLYKLNDIKICLGGKERYNSVLNALEHCPNDSLVAVHDAARPFVSKDLIFETFKSAQKYGGAILCKKVSDTIKIDDDNGIKTLNRDHLTAAETPQIFKCSELKSAIRYVIKNKLVITDDAHAMEYSKIPYHMHIHEGNNKKITYTSDLD
jgi:2-C-methyl-D-erythritol 4-phosphate cytidylyltransferase